MLALRALGYAVKDFDVSRFFRSAAPPVKQFGSRFAIGSAVNRLNAELLECVRTLGPSMRVIWVDKGIWVRPQVLREVRSIVRATLVHYTPDAHFGEGILRHRLFFANIPNYDVMFTTKKFEIAKYKENGGSEIRLVQQSYDDQTLYPRTLDANERSKFQSETCFLGQYERFRASRLERISRTGIDLKLWGPGWKRRLWRHPALRLAFCGVGAFGRDYANAILATDIALCFLTKRIPETATTRTFEIPGCGAFMVAERSEEHQNLFEEGKEAEYFSSADEMLDKLQFYLRRPSLRRLIAEAGFQRCIRSGYGNRARMKELMNHVKVIAMRGL